MSVNKVIYGTTVLVDLTADTVTAATLAQGYTAHGADGEAITGTMTGGPVYTRLWTNSNPTANFAAQDVTLADAAGNYDALRIVWEYNKSVGATAANWESYANTIAIMYDISDGKISRYTSGTGKVFMGVVNYATSYCYMRRCWLAYGWPSYTEYTTMHFDQIYRANNANNDTAMLSPLLVDGATF